MTTDGWEQRLAGLGQAREAIEPGLSLEANARRLAWFTDAELVAEIGRRRALDVPT